MIQTFVCRWKVTLGKKIPKDMVKQGSTRIAKGQARAAGSTHIWVHALHTVLRSMQLVPYRTVAWTKVPLYSTARAVAAAAAAAGSSYTVFRCDTCNLLVQSEELYQQHLEGAAHKKVQLFIKSLRTAGNY